MIRPFALAILVLSTPALAAPRGQVVDPSSGPKARAVPPPSGAIYGWVDGRGAWHFVDALTLVPLAYRNQALAHAHGTEDWNPKASENRGPELERKVRETGRKAAVPRISKKEAARQRAVELRTERIEVEKQLARVEEGGAPTEGEESAAEKDLQDRVAWLEKKLESLDQEIAALEASVGPGKPEDFGVADDEL